MNKFLCIVYVLAAFGALAHAVDFPSAPVNVSATPGGNSVSLMWDAVNNATKYALTVSDGQQVTTSQTMAQFGGLMSVSSYTVSITSLGANDTMGESTTISFTTKLGRVSGLAMESATETSITVTWDQLNGAGSYTVRAVNVDGEAIYNETVVGESVTISGLSPFSFYDVYINGVAGSDIGAEAMIRARTDGTGIRMTNFWDANGFLIGGEGTIYRQLEIGLGEFRLAVQFPCDNMNAKFWNAEVDNFNSRPESGYFELVQRELWMKKKTMIGMNFAISNGTCNFANESASVLLGDDIIAARAQGVQDPVDERVTPIDLEQFQWSNSSTTTNSAGWLKFRLNENFHDFQNEDSNATTTLKPTTGEFIITLNTGAGCPGGIIISQTWGMNLKNTSGIDSVPANTFYFTQYENNLWYNQETGLIYGYDPVVCPDQFTMEASVITGGPQIALIHQQPNARSLY